MTEYLLINNAKDQIELIEQALKALKKSMKKPDLDASTGISKIVADNSVRLVSIISQWKGYKSAR